MTERRKEDRKKVMAFTPVYDLDRGSLLGYLGDLTFQGAMVIGEKTLEIDKQITLAIEFSGNLPGVTTKRMVIPARVARCDQDEVPRSFKIGFEFIDIKPEQTKIIEALLERYHSRHQLYSD